ncbi:hypothetical protein [Wukongibacter sp. M2B1]|uniref:hypothetical protein n=1 Tax=Wukongibacter sp. M2B1 TaxID=3088895 RepID=UPI003D79B95F
MVKRFIPIIILVSIEIYFYLKTDPKNLEMFFMIWGAISLALLFYNIINVQDSGTMRFLDMSSNRDASKFTGLLLERWYATDKNKKRSFGGLFDPVNIQWIFAVIANVVGYILVMTK